MVNNTTGLQNFCMLDLSEMIGNHASKLLFGNGFILSSEYPEYQQAIDNFKQWNDFLSIFYQGEKVNSYYGYSILLLDKTETGQIHISLAQPYAVSRVVKIFDSEENGSYMVTCTIWWPSHICLHNLYTY